MPILHDGPINEGVEALNGHPIGPEEMLVARNSSLAARHRNDDSSARVEHIAGRVSHFLADRRPSPYCDDCIADKLGLSSRRQANRVTLRLAEIPNFRRSVAACSGCSKHKEVIRNV